MIWILGLCRSIGIKAICERFHKQGDLNIDPKMLLALF